MRSEVIDKILQVEDQAQAIRDKAEEDASSIVLEAQSEAARNVKESQENERRHSDQLVNDQTALTQEKIRAIEKESDALSKMQISVDEALVDEAADRILRLVTAVPLFGGES